MCFDGSSEDGGSENDGYISFADMFDGGGPGRSGARFSGAGVGALDQNKDNYISEAEYLSGEQHSKTNKQRGISGPDDGPIGYAYDNRNNFISGISNAFGALPRGSIASEAALGPEYGSPIETKNIARFMQRGGVLGTIGRGLTGGNIMSPEYVAPEMGDMTRDEYDRAIVKSFNSIGNTGEQPVPQEVAAAMGRIRGLNPRAVSVGSSIGPVTRYMDESPKARGTQTETAEPNYVFEPVTGDFLVIGPSGEVLSRIPASALNMQNQ